MTQKKNKKKKKKKKKNRAQISTHAAPRKSNQGRGGLLSLFTPSEIVA